MLTATMEGRTLVLVRETEDGAEFDLAMRATSDGQFVDFNIHVIIKSVEGICENATSFVTYPNPTSNTLTLAVANVQQFDYEIYNATGQLVKSGNAIGQETRIDLSDCPQGVYFISVIYHSNRLMQKVIVR